MNARGFTLLEMLVVLVLSAIILGALAQGTHIGLGSVATAERWTGETDDIAETDVLLRSLVRGVDPGDPVLDPHAVIGHADSLAFRTTLPSIPPGARIADADVRIAVVRHRLVLFWTSALPAPRATPVPHEVVLLAHVEALRIAYRAASDPPGTWRDTFDAADTPLLIRFRITRDAARALPDIVAAPFRLAAQAT